jgi:hypothetical protein
MWFPEGTGDSWLFGYLQIASLADPLELSLNLLSGEEGEPATELDGLTGSAIGKLRIGMQTRYVLVSPATVDWDPCCDDPAIPARRPHGSEGRREELVGQGLLVEAGGPP